MGGHDRQDPGSLDEVRRCLLKIEDLRIDLVIRRNDFSRVKPSLPAYVNKHNLC